VNDKPTITEKDRAMAEKCLKCPMCRHARKKQRGLAFWFVKKLESGVCPYCQAYEKVYGCKAHAPINETAEPKDPSKTLRRKKKLMAIITVVVGVYALLCYVILPMLWTHYEHHPVMADIAKQTTTKDGIPGDPLNVGLIGSQVELIRAMTAAGWKPADPITFHSSLNIVESVLLHRPYDYAPVSNLYLFGRKQDLAFEQIVGGSAKERHHVRFWSAPQLGEDNEPMWIGAVTFDRSVGISHRTGQITHHIGADVDAERDKLFSDLEHAGQIVKVYQVTGYGPTLNGHNGGGDRFYTDGEMDIGLISPDNRVQTTRPAIERNPAVVNFKNQVWQFVKKNVKHAE
jgi:hypothetical protein